LSSLTTQQEIRTPVEDRNVEQIEATVACQQKQIEALTAALQKVTAQIEMKERTPQIANNQ
jgi:hypothetical protein